MNRRSFGIAGLLLAVAISTPALADPVGTYDVTGINPDDGGEYHGTVTVNRTGETYSVTWTIAGTESNGVGIGGKRGNAATTGVASADDDMITSRMAPGRDIGPMPVARRFQRKHGSAAVAPGHWSGRKPRPARR
jgi:hypothetical protein